MAGGRQQYKSGGQSKGRISGKGGGTKTSASGTKKPEKGLTAALGHHVFTYGEKNSADMFRTSLVEMATHCGAALGSDIQTELTTRKRVTVTKPVHTQAQLNAHTEAETKRKAQATRLKDAKEKKLEAKKAVVKKGSRKGASDDAKEAALDAGIDVAELENEIEQLQDQIDKRATLELEGEEKKEWDSQWKTYHERTSKLEESRGKAFAKIKGQCTQILVEEMRTDPDHDAVMTSQDPLRLLALMDKTILKQADDTYPFAAVYNQMVSLL